MSTLIRPALSLLLLMTLITGVAYPLVVTGVAQVAFPDQANGSLMRDASDHQRVSDAGDQGHQDQQAQGRTYHCGHFKILEFSEEL